MNYPSTLPDTCTHIHKHTATTHLALCLKCTLSNPALFAWLTCFCICASCSHEAAIRSLPSNVLWTAAIHMSLRLEARHREACLWDQTGYTVPAFSHRYYLTMTETCSVNSTLTFHSVVSKGLNTMHGSARGHSTKWSHQQFISTINLSSYSFVCKMNRAICNWINP